MPATLEIIAERLARIEEMLAIQRPARASYTPKEFAQLVGRSYRWTVDRCAARTIRTVRSGGAYLIPAVEVERFRNGQLAITELAGGHRSTSAASGGVSEGGAAS